MIAAIKGNGVICIGYLECKEYGVPFEDYVRIENIPYFIDRETLVFFAQTNASSDFLIYNNEIFQGEISVDAIRKNILPQIRNIAKKYHNIENGRWSNALVICKEDKLFAITPDLYVRETMDYFCFGYSPEYAKSVLEMEQTLEPKDRIIKAFRFYDWCTGESGCPLIYIDTQDKQLKTLNRGNGDEHNISV